MRCNILLSLFIVVLLSIGTAFGQETEKASSGQEKGGGDLRAAVQNPVGAMISLPLKFTTDFGAPNGSAYFLNVNPVVPFTIGDWNLINRALIPTSSAWTGTSKGPLIFLKVDRPWIGRPG